MKHNNDLNPELIEDFLPVLKKIGSGRVAVSLGGSHGRGTADAHSDYDFRIFADSIEDASSQKGSDLWNIVKVLKKKYETKNITVDEPWPRRIKAVEAGLDEWRDGTARALEMTWTIWGYYLPADILNQRVLYDPEMIIDSWFSKMQPYPYTLKQSVISRHAEILKYWKDDYHCLSKIAREDYVFLAGLTVKMLHSIFQILFALNETYYPGDGNNLLYTRSFEKIPREFESRVNAILVHKGRRETLKEQQYEVRSLAGEVLDLVDEVYCDE
jgi:hypothetical protein